MFHNSMQKVLIAGISPTGETTLEFAAGMLRFQSELLREPNVQAAFEIFRTIDDALSYFHVNSEELDICVCINTNMFIDTAFLTKHDMTKPFVVGVYAIPGKIDWERVTEKITSSAEDLPLIGNVYNIDLAKATPAAGTYLQVSRAQLGIFKLTRDGLNDLIQRHKSDILSDDGKTLVLHAPCIYKGKALTADERVCALWNKPLYADTSQKTRSSGPLAFTGCVGMRKTLR